MRILYCIPNLGEGGAERQLSYIAAHLSSVGHEVHVASSRGGTNLERFRSAGVEWHRLGGVCNRDPVILLRLIGLMRRLRPDVVQTILTPMDLMGGAAALLTRTPWLLRESSSASLYRSGLRHRWRLVLARRVHGIVCNSAGGADYWGSFAGARPLDIIRNGVPLDEIVKAEDGFDVDLRLPEGAKMLLFAGRLDDGKNVDNFVVALSRIANQSNFRAVVCGDGPRRRRLERLAKELGIEDRLIFTGYVSNLWTLMKRADAVVSLSRFEGCPNVIMEAMACGCPLVVSDIPAHREILDESTAYFVDPEQPEQAASAIAEVLQFGERTSERARTAQLKVAQYTVEAAASQYERVYLRLLSDAENRRERPLVTNAECAHANER